MPLSCLFHCRCENNQVLWQNGSLIGVGMDSRANSWKHRRRQAQRETARDRKRDWERGRSRVRVSEAAKIFAYIRFGQVSTYVFCGRIGLLCCCRWCSTMLHASMLSMHQVKIAHHVAVATTLNGNWLTTGQRLWISSIIGRLLL